MDLLKEHGVIESVDEVHENIMLPQHELQKIIEIAEQHPMAVTPHYLNLIEPANPHDPIKKMAVPSLGELSLEGSFDTSGEKENTKIQGLQHKYGQTALVLVTNKCAMYCRHCFRKRLVGVEEDEVARDWPAIQTYIEGHEEIRNVLLSGGDALMVSTPELREILNRLVDIPHLNYIRIGSRTPVVLPSRINEDDELLELLAEKCQEKRIYLTTQFNHPLELADESKEAIRRLQQAGLVVNNQTVLLRGVNDDPEVMAELMESITSVGVVPYYIFQCRPVRRVKESFQVPLLEACDIIDQVRARLDGLTKRFRFAMSHKTGKIELIGRQGQQLFCKYHQAKDPARMNMFFSKEISPETGWLDCDGEGQDC